MVRSRGQKRTHSGVSRRPKGLAEREPSIPPLRAARSPTAWEEGVSLDTGYPEAWSRRENRASVVRLGSPRNGLARKLHGPWRYILPIDLIPRRPHPHHSGFSTHDIQTYDTHQQRLYFPLRLRKTVARGLALRVGTPGAGGGRPKTSNLLR